MYLVWDEKIITDFSDKNINSLYDEGYVFTRMRKGVMQQTRSLRIDLSQFELTSENRRILKKTDGLTVSSVPLPFSAYHWSIGKMAKDFYETKFGEGVFSANKIKELLTDSEKSNFNLLFCYTEGDQTLGYCIARATDEMIHYSYPFYDLNKTPKDMGLGMMIRAVQHAKGAGKKYIYLGAIQRPSDTYKLQLQGIEGWNKEEWIKDISVLKNALTVTS